MTGKSEKDPARPSPTGWRKLLTIPGLIGVTALGAVVTWGATEFVTFVRDEVTASDPVSIAVESNPAQTSAFAGLPVDVRLPAGSRPSTGPGPGCTGFRPWAHEQGGADAGATRLQIVLQGRTSGQVLISNARAVIVARETPAPGVDLTCPPAGEAELRALAIDLDQRDPRARYQSADGREFGFTLEQGEIETFSVTATASKATYTWYLELTVVVGDESRTVRVDDGGRPFRTTTPIQAKRWEWDYENAWTRQTDDGTSTRIPAGGRLDNGPA